MGYFYMCYCLCLPLPLYRDVMKLRGRQFTSDGTHLFATHNRSHLESGEPENYKFECEKGASLPDFPGLYE